MSDDRIRVSKRTSTTLTLRDEDTVAVSGRGVVLDVHAASTTAGEVVINGKSADIYFHVPERATVTVKVKERGSNIRIDGRGTVRLHADGFSTTVTVSPTVTLNQRSLTGIGTTVEEATDIEPNHDTEHIDEGDSLTEAESRLITATRAEALTDVGWFGHYGVRYDRVVREQPFCQSCGSEDGGAMVEEVLEEGFVVFGVPVQKTEQTIGHRCSNCYVADETLRQQALQELHTGDVAGLEQTETNSE